MASPHFRAPNAALQSLMDQIEGKEQEVTALEKELGERIANPVPEARLPKTRANEGPENRKKQLRIGEEMSRITSDIHKLKDLTPEGCPITGQENVDDSIRFFLTVGDLQKQNEAMRSHLDICTRNLNSIEADANNTNDLIAEYEELNKALTEARKKDDKDKSKGSVGQKTEELDQQIRSTNQVYKKIKGFLAQLLSRMAPEDGEDGSLAKLLQVLWNSFTEGSENWVDITGLEFDIEDEIVHQLEHSGIIEVHEDGVKIRFIDFTE